MKKIINKFNLKKIIIIILSLILLMFICVNSYAQVEIVNPQKVNDFNNDTKEIVLYQEYPVVDVYGPIVWAIDIPSKKWTLSFCNNGITFSLAKAGWYKIYEQVGDILVKDVYFFDDAGLMVTGFIQTINGDKYYMQEKKNANEGKMVYWWHEVANGRWYYFGGNGVLQENNILPKEIVLDSKGQQVIEKSHSTVIGPKME